MQKASDLLFRARSVQRWIAEERMEARSVALAVKSGSVSVALKQG
jgi:hypothetical protein